MKDPDDELEAVSTEDAGARRKQTARLVFIGVVAALFSAVALDNRQSVSIGWVIDEVKVPLVFALVVTFLLGIAVGLLVARRRAH